MRPHRLRRAARHRALIGVSVLSLATLTGCAGGSGDTGDAIVRVAGHPITETTIDHSMSALAASASRAPGQPPFQTPVPPRYTACIAYLRKYGSDMVIEGTVPASSGLKGQCQHDYEKLRLKALYFFITYRWVVGEATELGVRLDGRQLAQQLTSLRRFYAGTATKEPEIAMSAELSLYTTKIQQQLEARAGRQALSPQRRQQALDSFGANFKKRWAAVTDCKRGSIVPLCKQYRPPGEFTGLVPPSVSLTNMTPE